MAALSVTPTAMPAITRRPVSAIMASASEDQVVKLTKREIEVLTLVVQGNSSKEVADKLFVSKRTVDFHLANIYDKLTSRTVYKQLSEGHTARIDSL